MLSVIRKFVLIIFVIGSYGNYLDIKYEHNEDSCNIQLNLINFLKEDLQLWSNKSSSLSCQTKMISNVDNLRNYLHSSITKLLSEMNLTIIDTEAQIFSIQTSDLLSIVSAIKTGDFCVARLKLFDNKKLTLKELMPVIYDNKLTNAENIIEFLNSFTNMEEIIFGYRLLFDEMKKNNHTASTAMTIIGYQVMNTFHKNSIKTENFIELRDNIPTSLKLFPWNKITYVTNIKNNEGLFATTQDNYEYDYKRRRVNTFTPSICNYTECHWNIISNINGTDFQLKNERFNEYLYSDTEILDNQRRLVFTSKIKNETLIGDKWQFENIHGSNDYFKIKNLYWNEYLYIENDFLFVKNYRKAFLWRLGDCEHEGCKWKISRVN